MAAGNWIVFDKAKAKLMNGGIDLDTDTLKMSLFRTSAAISRARSTFASLMAEISATGGYVSHGKSLGACSVKAGASAGVSYFTHPSRVFSAVAGALTNIRYAVITDESKGASAGLRPLVAFCALSTAQFTVASGSTLTVSAPATGAFDLSGATS